VNHVLAHLEWAKVYGAHLEGPGLSRAHLERASLTGAHLEGAIVGRVILDGAIELPEGLSPAIADLTDRHDPNRGPE
jgi:uncharacterized protein YjbI with pentapeptide repeats